MNEGFIASVAFAILAVMFAFNSCTPTYTVLDVEWAQRVCSTNGGLSSLTKWTPTATCKNGAVFKLKRQ